MNAPILPDTFYPDEPYEERISRWLVFEQEAEEMQRRERVAHEPTPPRPFWMRDCTNEIVLMQRGYL